MRVDFSSPWKLALVLLPGLLIVAFAAYGVMQSKPASDLPSAPPQSAVVLSYGLSPAGFGDSDGGVAVVRLRDGKSVRAAAPQTGYLERGTVVTVAAIPSGSPPAPYSVLHRGAPSGSPAGSTLAQRH